MSWRQEMTQWLFLTMETAWLAAIYLLLDALPPLAAGPSLAWILWLYWGMYAAGRLMAVRQWPRRVRWPMQYGLMLAFFALSFHYIYLADLAWPAGDWSFRNWMVELARSGAWKRFTVIVCGGFYAWLRGVYLARSQVDLKGFPGAFQLGLAAILAVMVLDVAVGIHIAGLPAVMAVFIAAGLLGFWSARAASLQAARGLRMQRKWLLFAMAAVCLVLAAALLVSSVVDRELLWMLLQPLLWLWKQFIRLLAFLASLLPDSESPAPLLPSQQGGPVEGEDLLRKLLDLGWLRPIVGRIYMLVWAVIVGGALFRVLRDLSRWLKRRRPAADGLVLESSAHGWWDDLKALFQALAQWASRCLSWPVRAARRLGLGAGEADSIREVYRRMLRWGARRKCPRAAGQTASEYLLVLEAHWPAAAADLRLMTCAYLEARYAPAGSGHHDLEAVRSAYRRLRGVKGKNRTQQPAG